MRAWTAGLAAIAVAWGASAAAAQDVKQAEREAEKAVQAILAGDRETQAPAVCDLLRSGIVSAVFGVDEAIVTYRPASKFVPQPLCTATWDLPDKEAREAACREEMMAQTQRRTQAMMAGKKFDEPMPACLKENQGASVSLTMMKNTYDSPGAAIADLESSVAQLEKGITVTVRGKEHTTQADFDDWMSGVGDKAAWSPQLSELLVAANGVRFAVTVRGAGDGAANRDRAIAVAKRVATAL